MKKIALFSMVALTLLFSQCKKNDVKPAATDEGIFISLNADYNGAKTGFDPTTGNFVWSNTTEYVNVGGSESGYLGQISGTGNGSSQTITFSGQIATPQTDETLYFMYLGNGSHAEATTGTETGTLDFSNQAGTQAGVTNYHIAVGSAVYDGTNSFDVTLEMKAAFARIDMSAFSGETVYVHGDDIYATATIDYTAGTISGGIKGYINVGTASADKFVALIPSTTTATTIKFDSNSKSGSISFLNGIRAGKFYAADNSGSALSFASTPQTESCKGLFSVARTRVGNIKVITKMVRFSPGNLQATTTDLGDNWTWHFAENQYDYVGNAAANNAINGNGSVSTNGTVDLFGCSTDATYYGINNSQSSEDYLGDFIDWGGLVIGNDAPGTWRTLTETDWYNMLTLVTYGNAKVKDVNGVIILPNNSELSIVTTLTSWSDNIISEYEWNNTYKSAGAVFLPAAGYRGDNVGATGTALYYITSSFDDDGYTVSIYKGQDGQPEYDSESRATGESVRLVRDVD